MNIDELYFVETYDEYDNFVKEESYNWYTAGYESGELVEDDVYTSYNDYMEFMDEETANNDERTLAGYNVYSISQMCEDLNNAIAEWAEVAE